MPDGNASLSRGVFFGLFFRYLRMRAYAINPILNAGIIKRDMIAKSSQRANGRQLAAHLLNAHDNEQVAVAEITGSMAQDLTGALDEWRALSRVTNCKKFLYSLSVNPDPAQTALTRGQYQDFIARVEKKLGLSGQPRAVIFHKKEGRDHCHVIWSRIIPGQLKAVPISHDHRSLQTVIRQFAKDHGLNLPNNMKKRNKPGQQTPPKPVSLHEKQQQERSGVGKEQRVQEITHIWRQTETGAALLQSLEQAGYHLARGKSIPYVLVDRFGEIHSLPRQIEGAATKDVRARLKDIPLSSLPPAETLKAQIQAALAVPPTEIFNQKAQASWKDLKHKQRRRRAGFKEQADFLKQTHREERTRLINTQKEHYHRIKEDRLQNQFGIFAPLLMKIPGLNRLIIRHNKKQDINLLHQYRQERHALKIRQKLACQDLTRQACAITRVEKRETRSLKTRLRRDYLQATALQNTLPAPPLSGEQKRPSSVITAHFNDQACLPDTKETIRDRFNQAGKEDGPAIKPHAPDLQYG